MGYWLSCDAATVSIRADTNMAQRIDSPDGAGVINIVAIELSRSTDRLISISTGNNPDQPPLPRHLRGSDTRPAA